MNMMEIIKTRKSIRTFDGRPLSEDDRAKLCAYMEEIPNPYNIQVEFMWLDAKEHGLSSPVINGETAYIAGKVKKQEHCEEAFGYSFEKLVLYAWSLGIGTTWIGGTLDRKIFEKAADVQPDELMIVVTPVGYPSNTPAAVDKKLRASVRGDERLPAKELFFQNDFSTPLTDQEMLNRLEAVRWSPSAVNKQPCRIVKDGSQYHFYKHSSLDTQSKAGWDVQKVDMSIALCHLLSIAKGELTLKDPGIATSETTEYVATVTVQDWI